MRSGVKSKDTVIGTGEEAVHGKTVAANIRLFLNHGTELTGALTGSPRMVTRIGRLAWSDERLVQPPGWPSM